MLMRQGMPVKLVSVSPPLGHKTVHQANESVPVVALDKMNHLMQDNVFKTVLWFFCELRVKANSASARIAASPLGLHLPDVERVNGDIQYPRPSGDNRRGRCLDLLAIKLGN